MAFQPANREDFNALRLISRRLVRTPFLRPWQFRVEITDQPADFDLFVKDISYAPFELDTDETKAGVITLTYPTGVQPVGVEMTMRDHEDQRISTWVSELISRVYNHDGTVNLPAEYMIEFRRFALRDAGTREVETDVWEGYFTQLGDVSESRDEPGFLEFPVSFIQFRS